MKLYFNEEYVCDVNDHRQVVALITRYLETIGYKNPIYYHRMWRDYNDDIVIDFGSYHDFFYIKGAGTLDYGGNSI